MSSDAWSLGSGVEAAHPRSTDRQPWLTRVLHWSTVLAIVVGVAAVLWREAIEDDALRATLLAVHRQAGNYVLLALVCRLASRFGVGGLVDQAGRLPVVLRWGAHLSHSVL